MTEQIYPGVADRVKAIVADSMIIVFFMIAITYIFSYFENAPENARIIAFVFICLLYDPLFTSIFGGTLGHMAFNIRVKRQNNQSKNILFPLAIIRFIIKASLGIFSLITVTGNKKNKAIHDYVVGSIVVYAKPPKVIEEDLN